MNLIAALGAVEMGLTYALVAFGVWVSFRVLDFPDLTVDGAFPLRAAVTAASIVAGLDPWSATLLAVAAGAFAGMVTAVLAKRFGILPLLAGMLTMTALYSINIRIMGAPNVALLRQETIFDSFAVLALRNAFLVPLMLALLVLAVKLLLDWFFATEIGLGVRAQGANPRMAEANGVPGLATTILGLAIANGTVALGGAMFAQAQGFADVGMGIGTIIIGLAAVIAGEVLFRSRRFGWRTTGCIAGAVVYWFFLSLAMRSGDLGLRPSDLNLLTAVLVGAAMVAPALIIQARRKARA